MHIKPPSFFSVHFCVTLAPQLIFCECVQWLPMSSLPSYCSAPLLPFTVTKMCRGYMLCMATLRHMMQYNQYINALYTFMCDDFCSLCIIIMCLYDLHCGAVFSITPTGFTVWTNMANFQGSYKTAKRTRTLLNSAYFRFFTNLQHTFI